jgi:hypothetical protein
MPNQEQNIELIEQITHLLDLSQRWLKIEEACSYAKMSRNTLMKCIDNGDIKGKKRKKGGWIIDRLSIDEYNGSVTEDALFADIARRAGL